MKIHKHKKIDFVIPVLDYIRVFFLYYITFKIIYKFYFILIFFIFISYLILSNFNIKFTHTK